MLDWLVFHYLLLKFWFEECFLDLYRLIYLGWTVFILVYGMWFSCLRTKLLVMQSPIYFHAFLVKLIFQISHWSNVFVSTLKVGKKVMCAIKQQPPYIHLVEISYRNIFVSNSKLEVSDIIISPGVLAFPPTVNINRKKHHVT